MLSLLLLVAATQEDLEGRLQKLREVQAGMRREIEKVEGDIRKTEAELGGRRERGREEGPRPEGRRPEGVRPQAEGRRPEGGNEIQQLRREIAELREMVQNLARRGGGEESRRPQGRPEGERREGPGVEGFRERMREFGPEMRERMEGELRKRLPEFRERVRPGEEKPKPRVKKEDGSQEDRKPEGGKEDRKPEKDGEKDKPKKEGGEGR